MDDARGGVQKYYGFYNAVVRDLRDDGRVYVDVDSIVQKGLVARIATPAGGHGAQSGFRIRPSIGARCIVVFEQGDVKSPCILGFVEGKLAGNIGNLNPGEMSMRTKQGTQLSLNDNDFKITSTRGDGLQVDNSELNLKHRNYKLQALPGRVRVEQPGNIQFYNSGQAILKYNNFAQSTYDYKSISSGKREDVVDGNFTLESKNNLIQKASQINLSASEELNFTARNDTAFMTDTFSTTASTDIYMASVLGDIELASNAGTATVAAGTVSTADTGVTFAAAQLFLTQTGFAELTNNTVSMSFSSAGQISENALLGFEGTYGPNGVTVESIGPIESSTPLTHSIEAITSFDLTTQGVASIDATAGIAMATTGFLTATALTVDIAVTGAFSVTTAGAINMSSSITNINSPLISITTGLPVRGVKVLTLLGPQNIIPFV